MNDLSVQRLKPEEEELDRKRAELAQLEARLAERELELTTFRVQLAGLERRYVNTVGRRYAELDQLKAEIAEFSARLRPGDNVAQAQAAARRARADETARAVGDVGEAAPTRPFNPPDSLKKLYREAAKAIHPDLATDDAERARRQKIMAEVNDAYAEGDEERLRAILRHWEASPESVKGEGAAAELVRTIRKIAQAQHRLRAIERRK